MENRDMSFFMQTEEERSEVVIPGISKFKYPTDGPDYKKGDIIPWVLKPITTNLLDQLTKDNTTTKIRKGKQVKNIDDKRLTYQTMIETIKYPNFKDKVWLDSQNFVDPVDLISKVLDLPGDYSRISKEVLAANGIGNDETEEEIIEEAKN